MTQMLIGETSTSGSHPDAVSVINPATREVVDEVAVASPKDVDLAVRTAARAQADWANVDVYQRSKTILDAVAHSRTKVRELADLLVEEQGKPTVEAFGEVTHFFELLEHFAHLATSQRGGFQTLPNMLGKAYGLVTNHPLGVVAAIGPWNYPVALLGSKIGPALITGNAVVAKPAETTPRTLVAVAQALLDGGLPPGLLNVVTGPGQPTGESLVTHPLVAKVAFTGETSTGRRIMELAGPALKRVTLELGGSDAAIVCPDADLSLAVKGINIGRFWNAGQSCLAPKRCFVFEEVFDDFVERMTAQVQRYELGPGSTKAEKPGIRMGPVHSERQRAEIEAQVSDAVDGGATIVGGGTGEGDGFYVAPSLLLNAPEGSRVMNEEVFGPVLPILSVGSLDEAIARSNASSYGLGATVWTYDMRNVEQAATRLDVGIVWTNNVPYSYDQLPFGGVGQSGLGREGGPEVLGHYQETRTVVLGGL